MTKIIKGVVLVAVCLLCFGWWASCDSGEKEYRDVSRHGEPVSVWVDFSRSSAAQRFFVYDNREKKLIAKSKCAHGSGGGSTWNKPVFSNDPGSNCSSLGEYRLRCNDKMITYAAPCIRIDGLNKTNSNVAARGVVIHECPVIAESWTTGVPIPTTPLISQGCFGISTPVFKMLQELVADGKQIYLYATREE